MTEQGETSRRNQDLWAPWRMEYISTLADPDDGCFLCHDRDNPAADDANLVLWRGRRCFVVMNRFPYTGGHTLIAPLDHIAELGELDDDVLHEMMELTRDVQRIIGHVVHAHGYNVGMNLGRCAGAGLPGHLHMHVVPRWLGDTNFMSVLGDVRVIPQLLETLHTELRAAGVALGLPKLRT